MIELRPASPLTESIVTISTDNKKIRLHLGEYNDDFRLAARALRYQWERPYWERVINKFNGPLEDRMIEVAYKLLQQNFIICLPDDSLHDRIIAGEYEAEHTRWIVKRVADKYNNWFAINWAYGEDYYNRAKKITGARWYKPQMVVPASHYDEVVDFAELYGFGLSEGAQELIAAAEKRRSEQIRVELRPRIIAPFIAP